MADTGVAGRVSRLIARSGLTQGDFAAKVGMDPSKMSKALSGVRRFTSLDLANIADLTGVTVDYLVLSDTSKPALAARALASDISAVNYAIREASRLAALRADLVFLGYPSEDRPQIRRQMSGKQVDVGTDLADRAFAILDNEFSDLRHTDLIDAVERVFNVDVAVVELDPGCDGLAWRDANSSLIILRASDNPTRQRFTLAHELGHLLAEDDQSLHVDEVVMNGSKDLSELRANAFAAAFLMPRTSIMARVQRDRMTQDLFCRLAIEFTVSPSSLAFRLYNLDLIGRTEREEWGSFTTSWCANRANEVDTLSAWIHESKQERVPARIARDLLRAYIQGQSSLRPYANLIGTPVDALREMLEAVQPPTLQDEAGSFAP